MQQHLLLNFIIGGIIVATTSWLGAFTGPLPAAIFWSFPYTLLPSIYFIKQIGKSNTYISKFILSTGYALILLLIALFSLSYFVKNDNSKDLLIPILKTIAIWGFTSYIFYVLVKKFDLEDKFM